MRRGRAPKAVVVAADMAVAGEDKGDMAAIREDLAVVKGDTVAIREDLVAAKGNSVWAEAEVEKVTDDKGLAIVANRMFALC
jgi:hypothetical protein